ncbi:MAG: ribonuclease H-like domain-containing protein [Anaerococcus sp.]|nr:ribonuclease H-like domain-containing protein [Anaerococcus sp.]
MITIRKEIKVKNLEENQIILDIETTGLDSSVDFLVLLGFIETKGDKSYSYQYFAIDDNEEERLLRIYLKKIKDKKVITYNGDTFDLPFLNRRLLNYGLNPVFPNSLDLLKKVKGYRYYFDFPSLKLMDMEKYLGFYRKDPSRYKTFSKLSDDLIKRDNPYPILKHNENDIIATELILGLEEIFTKKLTITTRLTNLTLQRAYINNDIANLRFHIGKELPESFFMGENYQLKASLNNVSIDIQVLYGLLDGKNRGYITINNFDIKDLSGLKVDRHFLPIRNGRIYEYKNILNLGKKIIENHF